ncbi:NAD-dependent epimerase/dehydratase family protein, partial [Parabacteroides goldsteinii]
GAGVSRQDTRVFAQFAKSVISGQDIVMHTSGESAKPYCYTIDAIIALFYLLLKGEPGKAYNVATPNTYISIYDLAHLLVKKFNKNCHVVIEARDNMGYAPVTKLNLSTEKLEALGWKPFFKLEEMFDRLINYYKSIQ